MDVRWWWSWTVASITEVNWLYRISKVSSIARKLKSSSGAFKIHIHINCKKSLRVPCKFLCLAQGLPDCIGPYDNLLFTYRCPSLLGRLHEHRAGPDRGVREWPTEEQVRRCLHPWQQRAVHLDAEEKSLTGARYSPFTFSTLVFGCCCCLYWMRHVRSIRARYI